jgi:mRNA interferase HigB
MRLVNERLIARFRRKHPDSISWLDNWLKVTREADWRTIQEVKALFPAVDGGVKVSGGHTVTVFDVSGNKYRMIVTIIYESQLVTILELLTHSEYSKNLWKERH